MQTLVIALVGGIIGVVSTISAASVLDLIAARLVAFEGLVRPTIQVLLGGFAIPFVMSFVSAAAA